MKTLLLGNLWMPVFILLSFISHSPMQHTEFMRLTTGNELSWQLNPIPPAYLFSIKGPFPGKQTAQFQAWVEEIKINASKDAILFMLSVMAPRGYHRGCKYGKESFYVLTLPTQLNVKSFSPKFAFKIVKRKWHMDFEFFPHHGPCSSRCCKFGKGL